MNFIERFLNNAARRPEKIAIHFKDSALSYDQARVQVLRLCSVLENMGVSRGSRIILLLHNSPEFTLSMLAAAALGATIVPLDISHGRETIARSASSADAEFLIGAHTAIKKLLGDNAEPFPIPGHRMLAIGGNTAGCAEFSLSDQDAEPEYSLEQLDDANELDYILTMTSGSTSEPKPIVFTQGTKLRRSLQGARDLYGLDENDVILTASPMHHSLGQRLALLPLLIGATSVILPKFSPGLWLAAVEAHRVTFTIAVSTHLELILRKLDGLVADISSLRSIVSSSALLKDAIKKECIERLGCDFHECYGASEVGIVSNLAPQDCRENLRSVGKALPYVDIKILDEKGESLPHGHVGEICCRSETAFSRYYNNETITRQSVVNGYFHTGDMGYLDESGYLHLRGRKKDVIIVGGINVYPTDIESVILTHPAIAECAVIGIDDAYFGEAVLALLVKKDSAGEMNIRELRTHCMQSLADFQQPMAYEVIDELPRNALGKIMKHKLRERFKGYDATAMLRRLME